MSGLQSIILVVEDHPALRQFACSALEGAGYLVLSVERAEEAFDVVRSHGGAIDLAIIDMILPGLSGLDLAAALSREFPSISVLYISGYVDSVAMESIAHRSPDRVLLKPFTAPELAGRVELLLRSKESAGLGQPENQRKSGSGSGS